MRSIVSSGSLRLVGLVAVLVLSLADPTPAASAATVEQGVQARAQRPSETEDGYYCRYVRGMSGAFYYKGLGSYTEWVPVGELHTGGNVKG